MTKFDIREFLKRWPTFYYAVGTVLGPVWWSGLSSGRFIKKFVSGEKILNVGSGPRMLHDKRVINVDIMPYPGVSIVAEASAIPLPAQSVDAMIFDNVFEHITDPGKVIKETVRLLKSGGHLYIATPFMYPFHSSPYDYNRWTIGGLKELVGPSFEIVESGVRCGPFSAVASIFSHIAATVFSFGSATARAFLFNVFMIAFLPIKLLDIVFAYWPGAEEVSAVLYIVAKKK